MLLPTFLSILTLQCPDGAPPPCRAAPRLAAAASANSVAILYFENRTRDSADTFLADGLTEELITRLSQVSRLDVKSRFESQRVRDSRNRDPGVLGRSLRAAYLVTGTLQQSGQRVRLNVALVRSATGRQVWGSVYDRTGTDPFTIQADIAQEVAAGIAGELLPAERASLARRPSSDAMASDLYLQGVGLVNTLSERGLRYGLELLDRAIARDPRFADAWSQKGFAWVMMADGYVDGRTGYAEARTAASRALALDSNNALAWSVLSHPTLLLDADPAGAIGQGARALALDSRSSLAHASRGVAMLKMGRQADALAELKRGLEADTSSVASTSIYLWTLGRLGMADSLALAVRRAQPALPEAVAPFEGVLKLLRGDAAGALRELSWSYYGGLVANEYFAALRQTGRQGAIQPALDSMLAVRQTGYFNAVPIASAYLALGDTNRAFEWLDRAWEERTSWVLTLAYDRTFEPLRTDPRFAALLRRMGQRP